ncbi:MAG: hypothetical protein ACOH2I_06005 [Pseudomonas sp.]
MTPLSCQILAAILTSHASQEVDEINPDDSHLQAGRELREWIKHRLVAVLEAGLDLQWLVSP